MPIGISTLTDFLLSKRGRESVTSIRLTFDRSMGLANIKRRAGTLSTAFGPRWYGYAYADAENHSVMVLEHVDSRAL